MRRLIIKAQARLDMLEIWHHIAKDSLDAAIRVEEKIDAEIKSLRELPGKGHARHDTRDPSIRFWRVYSYLIAYRYDENRVQIVRVVHGGRNMRAMFPGAN